MGSTTGRQQPKLVKSWAPGPIPHRRRLRPSRSRRGRLTSPPTAGPRSVGRRLAFAADTSGANRSSRLLATAPPGSCSSARGASSPLPAPPPKIAGAGRRPEADGRKRSGRGTGTHTRPRPPRLPRAPFPPVLTRSPAPMAPAINPPRGRPRRFVSFRFAPLLHVPPRP